MTPIDFHRAAILYRRSEARPARTLLLRLAIVAALFAFCFVAFWFGRDGLKDQLDGSMSALDVFYFAIVAISTTGFGDMVPVSNGMKLFTAFVLTPVRLIVWFILLGTAYELVVQRLIEAFRMSRLQANLVDHVVVCGVGDSGATAIAEMLSRGRDPASIVAIDRDEAAVRFAAERGCIGLKGDASQEALLRDAGIERAAAAIVCAGRDDSNVLITLTIRNVTAHLRIVANVREEENVKLLLQAGASTVVRPAEVVGYLLAGAVVNNHIVATALDLLDSRGPLRLIEREARAEEVGRSPRELAVGYCVRIYRNDRVVEITAAAAARIEQGDKLHIIESSAALAPQ
jgi:voltage-gated potassium channel